MKSMKGELGYPDLEVRSCVSFVGVGRSVEGKIGETVFSPVNEAVLWQVLNNVYAEARSGVHPRLNGPHGWSRWRAW